MKLLFVNAINKNRNIEDSFPHLGFGYIASYLDKHLPNQCEVKIIDDRVEETIRQFQPNILGVSSVSQNFMIAKSICALAKNTGISTVIGGVHISMLPESLDEYMDCGVIGEGEATMLDIVKAFRQHGTLDARALADIPGIVFRTKDGAIQKTARRESIQPMDSLPMPNRGILSVPSHSITSIFSSRGCPYDCVFCASARYWPGVRMFGPDYVIEELKEIVGRYHPRYISFKDDLFIANRQRLGKIVEFICREGLHRNTGFFVSCRANLVNREIAQMLKQMNVVQASMGLESGCRRVLHYLKGGNVDPEQGLAAVEYLTDAGIHANAAFIIGSPTETRDEAMETLAYIRKSRLSSFLVYVMTPFPGTPVWDYALSRGLVSNTMDFERLSVDFTPDGTDRIILSETLSRRELYDLYTIFQKEAARRRTGTRIKKMFSIPFTGLKRYFAAGSDNH
jgi:radical SAM superfamily enzyme YgiQ (UPF0313 family)